MKFNAGVLQAPTGMYVPLADNEPASKQMSDYMLKYNITPPDEIISDGKLHRFRGSGKVGQNNAWYVLNDCFGNFGDWKLTDSNGVSFVIKPNRPLTDAEEAQIELQRKATAKLVAEETEQRYKAVEQWCKEHWAEFTNAPLDHPYLVKKGLKKAYCAKLADRSLVVPLYNQAGVMTTVQFINPNGSKHYKTGGRVKGSFGLAGHGEVKFIAEGFATACSIFQETGWNCAIAFQANNIPEIAKIYPMATIVVDDDDAIQGQEYGAGMKYALQCTNNHILVDRVLSKNPHTGYDANDYMVEGGDLCTLLGCEKAPVLFIDFWDAVKQGEPTKWLIKDIIPARNKLMMLFASSGEGKTFFAIDWMLHIATGKPDWFGQRVNQGKVLYLCGEGLESAKERMAAWKQHYELPENYPVPLKILPDTLNLDRPVEVNALMDSVKDYLDGTPDFVVIDTLNLFMSGNENDTQESNNLIHGLKDMAKKWDCCICLVHHKGASESASDRARGSTVFKGAMDSQISITKDPKTKTYLFHHAKSKAGIQIEDKIFFLRTFTIEDWFDDVGENETCGVMDLYTEYVAPKQWTRGGEVVLTIGKDSHDYKKVTEDEEFFIKAFDKYKELYGNRYGLSRDNWREYAKTCSKDDKDASRRVSPTQKSREAGRLLASGKIVYDEEKDVYFEGLLQYSEVEETYENLVEDC